MNTATRSVRRQPGTRTRRLRGLAILPVALLAACGSSVPLDESDGGDAPAPIGPALQLDEATLASALVCPASFAAAHDPVLMIHGTGSTAENDWSWSYVPALGALGFDVCTVDLPYGAQGEIQQASEYVVYALRHMAARSGRRLTVIGYSQGALEARWAIRWWPDIRASVARYISLAGVQHGAPVSDIACAVPCTAAAAQMRPGSQFLAVLNGGDPTPGALPYTSLWSETDTTAQPPTSILEGAESVSLQSLCPGRSVSHTDILGDAVAFALVVDALTHAGPANAARIDPAACGITVAPGMDQARAASREARGLPLFAWYSVVAPKVIAEPPLAAYAQGALP